MRRNVSPVTPYPPEPAPFEPAAAPLSAPVCVTCSPAVPLCGLLACLSLPASSWGRDARPSAQRSSPARHRRGVAATQC